MVRKMVSRRSRRRLILRDKDELDAVRIASYERMPLDGFPANPLVNSYLTHAVCLVCLEGRDSFLPAVWIAEDAFHFGHVGQSRSGTCRKLRPRPYSRAALELPVVFNDRAAAERWAKILRR
jgi:hypothetical protein